MLFNTLKIEKSIWVVWFYVLLEKLIGMLNVAQCFIDVLPFYTEIMI